MRLRRSRYLLRLAAIGLPAVLLVFVAALGWLGRPSGALMPEAESALVSDTTVLVKREAWLSFEPAERDSVAGFIFYPGGRVAPEAYAPLARALAENGVLAVITPMPLNLAILNPNAAAAVIADYPRVDRWVIGGHSLGGVMAARFAHHNPDQVAGLLLLAAYPESQIDLAQSELAVTVMYGDRDGLATMPEIEASFVRLPAHAKRILIAGGNHAQFGWYGPQTGDRSPGISRRDQQNQLLKAVMSLIREAGN
jgi:dienelactone hydrolase